MGGFFLKIVGMSISASCLVLAVLLLRLVLKKAPRWICVLLWGLVALRLLMPFSIESDFSLVPDPLADGQIITNVGDMYIGETDTVEIYEGNAPQAGQPPVGSFISQEGSLNPAKTVGNTVYPILSWIWLAGMVLMLLYTLISYLLLRYRLRTAVRFRKGIFQSENVDSPFVLGIIKPKIYLPFRMDDQSLEYVIAHEQAHIRRKDHWWKPFGFILLAIHWFNPLMWIGYLLLCRDIELACDEKVIKQMDNENRANYTEALVTCSIHRRRIAACPLAFGEIGVKERVKSVMNYRKPAFWIILAAMVICLVVAVCFLTNPNADINDQLSVFIDGQIADHFQTEESEGNACCVNWELLGTRKHGPETTVYMWVLYEEYSMNNGELYAETGTHIPTVITIKQEDAQYKLIEYWEPRDGSYLVSDIREKFPWHLQRKALDSQRYIKQQQAENQQMALDYFQSLSAIDTTEPPTNETTAFAGDHLEPVDDNIDFVLKTDKLNGSIAEAILRQHKSDQPLGLLSTESHIILVHEAASGTPLAGQTGHVREETVYVYYLNMRFNVQGDRPEEHEGIYGSAAITFTVDADGIYTLKHFVKPESSVDHGADYDDQLVEKLVAASEDIAANEDQYNKHLLDSCWKNATAYMEHLKNQASAQPGGVSSEMVRPSEYLSYEWARQLYQSWTASMDSMTEPERFSSLAEVFDSIAQGSPLKQSKFAELVREIVNNDKLVFEDQEVFDLARDYAMVFSRLAKGDRDFGVQELKVKSLSVTAAQLDFSYWGEMWYSVKTVQMGEQWGTGEFTDPYQGELGQYLAVIRFHDAEPSAKWMEQYPKRTNHPIRISCGGSVHEMTMRIMNNADHGYDVYIGSDEPFSVEERSSVMLNRLFGTVSVPLSFG